MSPENLQYDDDELNELFGLGSTSPDPQTPKADFFTVSEITELFGVDEISDTDPVEPEIVVLDDSKLDKAVIVLGLFNAMVTKLGRPAKSPIFKCEGGVCPHEALQDWARQTEQEITDANGLITGYKLDSIPLRCAARKGEKPGHCGTTITQHGIIFFEEPGSRFDDDMVMG